MTFIDLRGKKRSLKSPNKYQIDWAKKTRSKFQDTVKQFLRPYWKRNFVFEEMPLVGTRSKFDFYNASQRIVLESSGLQHVQFVKHFQKTRSNFLGQVKRDLEKIEFCEANNILLVEIFEKDIYGRTPEEIVQFFADQGVIL